jgi:hypothetical protein
MARLKQCNIEDKELKKEINEIKKINEITDGKRLTLKEFFSNGEEMNGWRASIAFAAQAFQQIGGINIVTYCKYKYPSLPLNVTDHFRCHRRLRGLSGFRSCLCSTLDWRPWH